MKIKACKVSWSSACAANCRAKKWGLRLPGHLLLKFGVWEMAAMSSIGCFHTLPLSTLISVSEAEERNISPRLMSERAPPAGDKHKWVDTLIGTELPSHGSDPPPPQTDWDKSIRTDHILILYACVSWQPRANSHFCCRLPSGRWTILNMDLRFNNFSTKLATTVILTSVRMDNEWIRVYF